MVRSLVVMVLGLIGCWGARQEGQVSDGKMVPVEGWAKLVSVDQVLGTGVMEFEGKTMTFWWRNKQGGIFAPQGTLEPAARVDVALNVQPGEKFYLKGFRRRGEMLVTQAHVLRRDRREGANDPCASR